MLRELREAWRMVRISKEDGYTGPFVVLREPMMVEMQQVYGRVVAENKHYQEAIHDAIQGYSICKYCEDFEECKARKDWKDETCDDFMLRFPNTDECMSCFNELYRVCDRNCHEGGNYDG